MPSYNNQDHAAERGLGSFTVKYLIICKLKTKVIIKKHF